MSPSKKAVVAAWNTAISTHRYVFCHKLSSIIYLQFPPTMFQPLPASCCIHSCNSLKLLDQVFGKMRLERKSTPLLRTLCRSHRTIDLESVFFFFGFEEGTASSWLAARQKNEILHKFPSAMVGCCGGFYTLTKFTLE